MNEETDADLAQIRRICLGLPDTWEKVSHGAPTFFVGKSVFAMFVKGHHGKEGVAVWIPVPPGEQQVLVATEPRVFFRPPYVGVKGWIGITLDEMDEEDLGFYLHQAWKMIAAKGKKTSRERQAERRF